jgi:predicted MFS family arabinose efflux permease
MVAGMLSLDQGFQGGFGILAIPAILGLCVLLVGQRLYSNPREFETTTQDLRSEGLPKTFWVYLAAIAFVAAGYTDFPLIAFHLQQASIISTHQIPLLYAIAMGVDAIAALLFGRWFDRVGILSLAVAIGLSALFAPFVFLGNASLTLLGMVLWGIGMGAQESIMKAVVAGLVPPERRGSAFGIFNTDYGLAWFLGSALMGILYDYSISTLIVFSVVVQLVAIPILIGVQRQMHRS